MTPFPEPFSEPFPEPHLLPELPDRAGRAVREMTEMPPAFWAFHEQNHPAYLAYVEVQLGDREAAAQLVHRVWLDLAVSWAELLVQESPDAAAWAILRLHVTRQLAAWGREPALTQRAAFQRASRAVLESMRAQFAVLESSLGLFTAISRLQERHYDVIVLQYVLGYPPKRVASIMGVTQATVRAHRRTARARLAYELGLDHDADRDEEE